MSSFAGRALISWLLLCLGSVFCQAMAEEAKTGESEVIETPEVFISATKTEIPIKQVTSAVEVITGEQMQQRKIKNRDGGTSFSAGTCRLSKRRAGHTGSGAHARRHTAADTGVDRRRDCQQRYRWNLQLREFDDR